MLKPLPALASVFLIAASVFSQGSSGHTKDSLETVKQNLKADKAVLLDVREKKEWDAGHLRDAQLAPKSVLQTDSGLDAILRELPKGKIVYTHCGAGGRALACGEILKKHRIDVRPLKAGYKDLAQAGFEPAK